MKKESVALCVWCALISGTLILGIQSFRNKYDEIKEYRNAIGYPAIIRTCAGDSCAPCVVPISPAPTCRFGNVTAAKAKAARVGFCNCTTVIAGRYAATSGKKLPPASARATTAVMDRYSAVYSKADYYRLITKDQRVWGYNKTHEVFEQTARLAGSGVDGSIFSDWMFCAGEALFAEHGAWNSIYRLLVLILRFVFFVSCYTIAYKKRILPLLRKFAGIKEDAGLLEVLRAIGGEDVSSDYDNKVKNASGSGSGIDAASDPENDHDGVISEKKMVTRSVTNALILKSVLVAGTSSILVGGAITIVITLQAPVFKMSFDPLSGTINHVMHNGKAGQDNGGKPPEPSVFGNRTTMIKPDNPMLQLLTEWFQYLKTIENVRIQIASLERELNNHKSNNHISTRDIDMLNDKLENIEGKLDMFEKFEVEMKNIKKSIR